MRKKINCTVCIIGAGIVGLCVALEYIKNGMKNIIIIDKESKAGAHASGRNSGVLHAGIYYEPDSMKAKFCLNGNHQWKSFCKDHDCDLLENGKIIVCKNEQEHETLLSLFDRAKQNGAKVELISQKDCEKREPLAKTHKDAILSHETAVINPNEILEKMIQQIGKEKILFNQPVFKIPSENIIITPGYEIQFEKLINCAGTSAVKLAKQMGAAKDYELLPFKGIYKVCSEKLSKQINAHIYPVPDLRNPFLGIHFTKAISGKVYIVPTAMPALGPENYQFLEGLSTETLSILYKNARLFIENKAFRAVALTEPKNYIHSHFINQARALVHHLDDTQISNCPKVGIRPQLINWKTKQLEMDFKIEKTKTAVHVLNAISPAFTAAPAFAKLVVND